MPDLVIARLYLEPRQLAVPTLLRVSNSDVDFGVSSSVRMVCVVDAAAYVGVDDHAVGYPAQQRGCCGADTVGVCGKQGRNAR